MTGSVDEIEETEDEVEAIALDSLDAKANFFFFLLGPPVVD